MKIKQEIFFAGMDLDSDVHIIGNVGMGSFQGAYREMRNMMSGITGQSKSWVPQSIPSTVQITWNKPSGRCKCIGTATDHGLNVQYAFIWNENNNHTIIRYNPKPGQFGEIDIIAQGDFAWDEDKYITGIFSVDKKLLGWTDGVSAPRMINIDRAAEKNKKSEIRLYFPKWEQTIDDRSFSIQVLNNGVPVTPLLSSFYVATDSQVRDFGEMLRMWCSAFNSTLAGQFFEAHSCGTYVELTANNVGLFSVNSTLVDTILAISQPTVSMKWIYWNRYNDMWTDLQTYEAKFPYPCEPQLIVSSDLSRNINFLDRNYFQFAIRLRYRDGQITTISPYSSVPINTSSACSGSSSTPENVIIVSFPGDQFTDQSSMGEVIKVDVLVSINSGIWRLVETLEQADFVYSQTYRFYNDKNYPEIDQSAASLFASANPLLAEAQCVVCDNDSNSRVVKGGITKDYDNPCIDAKLTLTYDNSAISKRLVPVTFRVRILTPYLLQLGAPISLAGCINQPIHNLGDGQGIVYGGISPINAIDSFEHNPGTDYLQYAPNAGFIFYSAGRTGYWISRQVALNATLGCGTVGATLLSDNVYDSSRWGNSIFSQCNDTYRAAIRHLMNANVVYSEVTMYLEEGSTHIIRMADPRCTVGDTMGLGSYFDLSSDSLLWQRTSGDVYAMNGVEGQKEIFLTIPAGSGPINLDDCIILDGTNPAAIAESYVIKGYAYDNMGNSDAATLINEGVPTELQTVVFFPQALGIGPQLAVPYFPTATTTIPGYSYTFALLNEWGGHNPVLGGHARTDHNGYFYFINSTGGIGGLFTVKGALLGCTGNPATQPQFGTWAFIGAGINIVDLSILKPMNSAGFYEGEIGGALTPSPGSSFHSSNQAKYYILYNDDPLNSEKLSTYIEGQILTAFPGFVGLQDINILYERTGRYTSTDLNGDFRLRVWSDTIANANNRTGRLVAINNSACNVSFNPNIQTVLITIFQPNQSFSLSHPFVVGQIFATINSAASIQSGYAHGTTYVFGLIYKNRIGQATAAVTEDRLELVIPPMTAPAGSQGKPIIDISIFNDVPIPDVERFTEYQVVMGQPSFSRIYDVVASDVLYVERWDEGTNLPVSVSYASGAAKEIYLDVGTTFANFNEDNSEADWGYTFEEGDRLQILADENGTLFNGPNQFFDFAIKDQRGGTTTTALYVVIDNVLDMPELKDGVFIRIYRKNKEQTTFPYYEIPGLCLSINDPFGNPVHSQTNFTIQSGPIWYRYRTMRIANGRVYTYRVEDVSISDLFISQVQDTGRITFEDPDAQQKQYPGLLKFSNSYLPGSNYNGLNMYEPLNEKSIDINFGLIRWLGYIGQVMIAVTDWRSTAFYVNLDILRTGDDQFLTVLSDSFLGQHRDFLARYGTQNPESIIVADGPGVASAMVYGLDAQSGVVWGYSVNGLDVKEKYGIVTYIRDRSRALQRMDIASCPFGYDPKYEAILVSTGGLRNGQDSGQETIVFKESENHWVAFMDWLVDYYGYVGQRFLSYVGGDVWLHNEGKDYQVFHGIQRKPSITVVVNQDPSKVKIWKNLELKTGSKDWSAPLIINERGQQSRLNKVHFEIKEGVPKAAFLKDINTPHVNIPLHNGSPLRSETLTAKFENDSLNFVSLFTISVWYAYSELTNP